MTDSKHNTGTRSGFSRRAFLRGSSAVAAATALQQQAAAVAQDQKTEVVTGGKTITVEVNGKSQKVEVETRTTLLQMLRYQLDLTGAKPVSSDGSSGASTVLVNGKPVSAETVLAIACDGKKVQTVESLGGDKPDAVPRAFVENDALQCGFCTPGFVVAVRAFLDAHPQASDEEIRGGLNGNVCRCGTYANIVQAALSVVKGGGNG
jgi:xanthine dehydrogenase YagT iron-sulfur-binding subunit